LLKIEIYISLIDILSIYEILLHQLVKSLIQYYL